MKFFFVRFCILIILFQAYFMSVSLAEDFKNLRTIGEPVEGVMTLKMIPQDSVKVGQYFLIIRPDQNGSFDVLAKAQVEVIQNGKAFLHLDFDTLEKAPHRGDYLVEMSPPAADVEIDADNLRNMNLMPEEPPEEGDPGYIQIGYNSFAGQLESTGSTKANEYKDAPKYSLSGFEFLWFIDFLWRIGLQYESRTGQFETSNYYHETGQSNEKITQSSLLFRTRLFANKRFRSTYKIMKYNNEFATFNKDENLFSSVYEAMGVGYQLSYENTSAVWKPKKGSGIVFEGITLDLNYYPQITVRDIDISRGSGLASSNFYEYKISLNSLFYLNWLPWVKRYYFSLSYAVQDLNLQFSGSTQNETSGYYVIPEDGRYREHRSCWVAHIGIRFDDFIGRFLSPR